MKNIQVAISGIAENKEFNDALGLPTKTVVRPKLSDFICAKLQTNKVGLARMLKISPATVTKWLYTETKPSVDMIKRIGRYLGMSFDEVLELFEVD
ncbi:MAG: helix-turn-helix transcriptional regulator [Firmicutes bacterium]|nr:helix-turn-helix transcriptional regulator [Bacillota bacterium]